MKNVLLGCALIVGLLVTSSCSKDKCITCSYTDAAGTTTESVTTSLAAGLGLNCGDSATLDELEAGAQSEADAASATLSCTRD